MILTILIYKIKTLYCKFDIVDWINNLLIWNSF